MSIGEWFTEWGWWLIALLGGGAAVFLFSAITTRHVAVRIAGTTLGAFSISSGIGFLGLFGIGTPWLILLYPIVLAPAPRPSNSVEPTARSHHILPGHDEREGPAPSWHHLGALSGFARRVVFVSTVSIVEGRHLGMARAVAGSVLGSGLTLLLLVGGPQEIQRAIAIGGNAWPAAILLSGSVAYVGAFLGKEYRPRRWPAIWAFGWLVGVLLAIGFVAVFGSTGD